MRKSHNFSICRTEKLDMHFERLDRPLRSNNGLNLRSGWSRLHSRSLKHGGRESPEAQSHFTQGRPNREDQR
jgi:hypothetical protein